MTQAHESSALTPTTENRPADPAPAAPENRPCRRRTGRLIIAALVLAGLLAALAYWTLQWGVYRRALPVQNAGTTVTLTVKSGQSARDIPPALRAQGMVLPDWLWRAATRIHPNRLNKLHAGVYKIPAGVTPAGLLDVLDKGAIAGEQLRIPEGAPIWEVRALFNAAPNLRHTLNNLSDEQLARALDLPSASPEGWLAPDTYHYSAGATDLSVMRLAVQRQTEALKKAWDARDTSLSTLSSPYEALILASIIEKETGHAKDRTLISSVFHNRLKRKMPLQTDPTVIYGLGPTFDGHLGRKALRSDTPYNTYRIRALPPTPIAAPGRAAIEAALHPAASNYLYFVSRGDGTSEFSSSLAQHNRAVKQFILKQ